MTKQLERASNNVSISNFYEEYCVGKYNMNPPYQRLSVWSTEKKAFFIDSILKNLPIPPVFLRQKIDDNTGKTSYEVIDGKQRLTSIVEFIEDDFATTDEGEDPFHDEELAGKLFSELNNERMSHYKKLFWRYQIPVEYIDSDDPIVIDRIFDRLNRNGEPLNGQELRHSNYYDSELLKLAYHLSKLPFWADRLKTTDKARMEDVEFISELIFALIEKTELTATDKDLDQYYDKFSKSTEINWKLVENDFLRTTDFMSSLNLDYEEYKIYGVSHLYGIWCFSMSCLNNGIGVEKVSSKLIDFFTMIKERNYSHPIVQEYKQSMSNRTKFKGQRSKRRKALVDYCC
ncbi:DUF262 domain-containing protein [Aeromonas enteropelogenes]|uniref:DUF262 domain-containing protein n=1 Tax=Aeromonas enteropelogenes TaxID=29489 RepID=UPI000F51CE45|nr:DUF262 domain-containing protein [Aeromonas enteropelogenes]RQM58455.1 DUF262 domain-containing protein [Aeromonas enteropelogenes]